MMLILEILRIQNDLKDEISCECHPVGEVGETLIVFPCTLPPRCGTTC